MAVLGKVVIIIALLCFITIDANRARRHRRQTLLNDQQTVNSNSQAQSRQQQFSQSGIGIPKDVNLKQNQPGRQYYPNQGQYGYGGYQGSYGNQYGGGQYGQQYGQGGGDRPYGSYYNQYPGSNNYYSGYGSGGYGSGGYGSGGSYGSGGYGSGGYNRPGYGSNYYPSQGNYGGYYRNVGEKHNNNMFILMLSSLFTFTICLMKF